MFETKVIPFLRRRAVVSLSVERNDGNSEELCAIRACVVHCVVSVELVDKHETHEKMENADWNGSCNVTHCNSHSSLHSPF